MPQNFLQIPKPVTETIGLRGQNWRVSLYSEDAAAFKNENGEWAPEILTALEKNLGRNLKTNFAKQIVLNGIPFLAGFLFDRQEVALASPRLARESFLLSELNGASVEGELLKNHVEKIRGLDLKQAPSIIDRISDSYNLPTFFEDEFQATLKQCNALEETLLQEMSRYRPTFFERLSDFFLNVSAQYALFRIHLLKFVALLPALDHDQTGAEIKQIFLETLRRLVQDCKRAQEKVKIGQEASLPFPYLVFFQILHAGVKIFPASLLAKIIRALTRKMAGRFIGGESIEKANIVLENLFATHRDATLDQLGELVVSDKEADQYTADVLKLIRGFSQHVKKGNKNWAGIQRAHISIKVSALTPDFNPADPQYTFGLVAPRLKKILSAAKKEDVFVNIDAEHYPYRDLVFYIYKRVLLETQELKNFAATGIVIQAYLRDAYPHFEEILALVKKRGIPMPLRLVKGAYWDAETIEADAHAFDPPEFINKEESDIHFRQLIVKILEASPHLQLCLGSHNLSDHCFAEALRSERFPESPVIEHQCLHMTYESLSWGMAKMHWPVRNYVTVGSLLAGMAYLVRRILENSSQAGILAQSRFSHGVARPASPHLAHQSRREAGQFFQDTSLTHLGPQFFNTIPLRFYCREEKNILDVVFEKFTAKLGQDYSKEGYTGPLHKIFSPSDSKTPVGEIKLANKEEADKTVEAAYGAYTRGDWAKASPLERAGVLLKAADIMLKQRLELTALIVHEGGKNFREAIADVDEAIDFLNFYAREEVRLGKTNKNLVSRGVFAVISPWNFPLALPCGMTAGALAAGNHVILKPADATPLIAQRFTEILYAAGVPKDVFILLPGRGSEVGKVLVDHPKISGIVFTGSRETGLKIAHAAGVRIARNELFNFAAPVKIITEMGGKNAIIVTSSAEMDETVSGILYSAFGNAGQKCSAASRILVDEQVKEKLIARLKEACQDLQVGPAFEHATTVNPLISEKEKERLKNLAKEAVQEALLFGGRVLVDRSKEDLPGACMGPVLIEIPAAQSLKKESSAQKELFGPILHVIGCKDLKEAATLFNATEYALTGGIYSQSQDEVEFLQSRLEAGNIYVNRPCTGARVSIEPFGGFKLSGTGPKAGSPFYLDAFHVDITAVEKLKTKTIAIDKEGLEQYKQFIMQSLPHFLARRRWNRKIPGQISFNDFSLVKQKGLYVAVETQPNIKTFLYLLAALAIGSHVAVLCQTKAMFETWTFICQCLQELGFTAQNISALYFGEEKIREALLEKDLQFIILEGDEHQVAKILPEAFDENFSEQCLKTILTKLDAPALQDFGKYLEPFVLVRSFAINTLRYGAPMELEV